MTAGSLAEYLVKIGWDVGEKDWKKAKDLIKGFESSSLTGAARIGKAFTTSMAAVAYAVYGANKVLANFLDTLADADLQTEKTARMFWAAEKSVRAYQTALDALGETEGDLFYMTGEEYDRFLKLNALGKSLEAPKELDAFLVKIRDIQYEFSRLQVYLEYGKRWVAYWFNMMNADSIEKIRKFLSEANDWIYKNFPKITYYLAKIFDIVFRLGKSALAIVKALISAIQFIGSLLNSTFVKTTTLVAGFFLLLKSGPIGWIIATLTALLLVIDDYLTWKEGGISYFDWGKIEDKIGNIKESFSNVKESADDLKKSIDSMFKPLIDWLDKINAKQFILDSFKKILDFIAEDLKIISTTINLLVSGADKLINYIGDFSDTWGKLQQGIELYDGDNSQLSVGSKTAERLFSIYKNSHLQDAIENSKSPNTLGGIMQQVLNFEINTIPGMSEVQVAREVLDVLKNASYNTMFPG